MRPPYDTDLTDQEWETSANFAKSIQGRKTSNCEYAILPFSL